ncbi:MAG TPA: type II toxin-antitoxin system RelB/DinJ family antitoxin [Candidatus Sulfotelmatobacter sp.]
MAPSALVQTRIDPAVKERAAAVLEGLGITVSDAVRILLTRTANEGALPFELIHNATEHDAWFRAKVQEALNDPRPAIPRKEVKAHFAKRRAAALRKNKAR